MKRVEIFSAIFEDDSFVCSVRAESDLLGFKGRSGSGGAEGGSRYGGTEAEEEGDENEKEMRDMISFFAY